MRPFINPPRPPLLPKESPPAPPDSGKKRKGSTGGRWDVRGGPPPVTEQEKEENPKHQPQAGGLKQKSSSSRPSFKGIVSLPLPPPPVEEAGGGSAQADQAGVSKRKEPSRGVEGGQERISGNFKESMEVSGRKAKKSKKCLSDQGDKSSDSDSDSDMQYSDADSSEPEFLGIFGDMRRGEGGATQSSDAILEEKTGFSSLEGEADEMRSACQKVGRSGAVEGGASGKAEPDVAAVTAAKQYEEPDFATAAAAAALHGMSTSLPPAVLWTKKMIARLHKVYKKTEMLRKAAREYKRRGGAILVEGASDKHFVKSLDEVLGSGWGKRGVGGPGQFRTGAFYLAWPPVRPATGSSKSGIPLFAWVFQDLGIPCCALFDFDAIITGEAAKVPEEDCFVWDDRTKNLEGAMGTSKSACGGLAIKPKPRDLASILTNEEKGVALRSFVSFLEKKGAIKPI
uniref:Uncharacterized protein n=1 Tax=Chromera velia CCMP2878 TaxID=1169474 RepID=A0A0G4G0X0_9ALVE|eukprot:Cvel_19596.t1-p1 / transcript=Cvel_19596.t1 / gene=Cvel_19596 / organism=Chromera_velia_CCMP2878 / gene_product=hypothetical protein / transcript_product=hypothetical protein / location=Cvel_scaffold1703:13587-15628(-) / protein_length=454 / sequence_SO=supercontig / SO=protein_coding / is_pseudo=false